jgi:MFS family permease
VVVDDRGLSGYRTRRCTRVRLGRRADTVVPVQCLAMPLWRQPDFVKLWGGQTVSLLGTQVTGLALSLTAAVLLRATPAEMGLIGSLNVLPFVFFGLPAGLLVDRVRRRPLMIAADLGRAVLLASVPVAFVLGRLSIPQLYVVSFGMGALSVAFRVAYGSYLPSVVSREDLADGNAKLALAEAIARVGGPGLAGALVQLLSAPIAILVDSASFLVSVASLRAIRAREDSPRTTEGGGAWRELREGLHAVFGQHLLRPLFFGTTLGNVADGVVFQSGVVVLFFTRELHLEPATIGAVFAGLGIGGLLGALIASPARRALGLGSSILGCLGLWSVGYGGMAFIAPSPLAPLVAGLLLGAVGAINPIAGANVSTVRQSVTPRDLLGRVTAVANVGAATAITGGSFAGGLVADIIGLRPTLVIGGLLPLLGLICLLLSPVRRLRTLDTLQPLYMAAD